MKKLIAAAFTLLLMGSAGAAFAARCTQETEDGKKIVLEGSECTVVDGNCKCTD
jgi:hypothetical protein